MSMETPHLVKHDTTVAEEAFQVDVQQGKFDVTIGRVVEGLGTSCGFTIVERSNA